MLVMKTENADNH